MSEATTTLKTKSGFTLIELMVALSIGSLVIAGVLSAFIYFINGTDQSSVYSRANLNAATAVDRILQPSKSASGLRQFSKSETTIIQTGDGWILSDSPTNGYIYSASANTISDRHGHVLSKNIIVATAQFTQLGSGASQTDNIQISITVEEGNERNNHEATYVTFVCPRNK